MKPPKQTTKPTQKQYLDAALKELDDNLLIRGIDNWLGYRTPETLKLSVSGATNLVELINSMNTEIGRLSAIVGELVVELEQTKTTPTK
jgi:hypothetical protein